jgi:hypothetical protein
MASFYRNNIGIVKITENRNGNMETSPIPIIKNKTIIITYYSQ